MKYEIDEHELKGLVEYLLRAPMIHVEQAVVFLRSLKPAEEATRAEEK